MSADVATATYERFEKRCKEAEQAAKASGSVWINYPAYHWCAPDEMHLGDLYHEHGPRRKMVEGDLYA